MFRMDIILIQDLALFQTRLIMTNLLAVQLFMAPIASKCNSLTLCFRITQQVQNLEVPLPSAIMEQL